MAAAAAFLPDDIIYNIVAKLPAKPLVRFRCVSKYWNHMLTQRDFMKFRSRKTFILPLPDDSIHLIDTTTSAIAERRYLYSSKQREFHRIENLNVIGSFSGIVILSNGRSLFTLYNPFTGKYVNLKPPGVRGTTACGFGYGASPIKSELKIVRFIHCSTSTCFDVYSFKDNHWSKHFYHAVIKFQHEVGHFLNGSLYWIASNTSALIVINLKDLNQSQIHLPYDKNTFINSGHSIDLLGTMNGCLCSLHQISNGGFDMWVMKEHGQWSKMYSLELPDLKVNVDMACSYYPLCILEADRLILMADPCENLIIYDMLRKSYKRLENISMNGVRVHVMAIVETLVSPANFLKKYENFMPGQLRNRRMES